MKRMMRIIALLMATLMVVTSCQAPDSGNRLSDETVDVSFAGPSARTITTDDGLVQTVATSDLWFQYKAVWQGEGEIPYTAKNEWTSLNEKGLTSTVKLHRGTWELSLRAFVNESDLDNDSKYILSGTLPRVEIGANNMVTQTVSISLGYVRQEGNGTLHVSATYPLVYTDETDQEGNPVKAVRKIKVTANVSGTDYTGEITVFDSNNVGSLDLTVPAGAAHVTVQYYLDDSNLFEDDKASKDVLIMATMTTRLAVSVDRDITAVTFKAEQPAGTVEDNVLPKVFNSVLDIYPDKINDNEIVIGYAEKTKALGDQTPITYPYTSNAAASRDEQGRYKASDLNLVPITVTTDVDLRASGATEAWWGKTAVGGDVNMEEPNTTLASVRFVDGVTEIKDYAFVGFVALTSVEIPVTVTSIGNYAFAACPGLTSVTIPDNVTSIGHLAFMSCTSLANVTISESVTSIGAQAFAGCTGLTRVTIPDSVTEISAGAFYGCTGLTSVTIPDSVTIIGRFAFNDCTSLTSLNYSGNREQWNLIGFTDDIDIVCLDGNVVYKIGKTTNDNSVRFYVAGLTPYGKNNCTELSIPNCVTSINNSAFNGCTRLTSVTIPDSVTSIGTEAFKGCISLGNITIPDSVTKIEYQAFANCTGLTSVTISDNVTIIDNFAFSGCSNLNNITIPDSVTTIGGRAFDGCTALTSITIPDSVTIIGGYAFNGCTSLTSVTIPECITSIGSQTFNGCSALNDITYTGTIEQWHAFGYAWEYGFNDVDIMCRDGKAMFTTKKITFTDGTVGLSVCGLTPYGKTNCTEITIPEGVTEIGNSAFTGCTNLTRVTIPDSVTSIGYDAFKDCTGLTSVTIPSNVTSIGNYAFAVCTSLTNVIISEGVTSIGTNAFAGCTGLTSITIPDSVTSIGKEAFFNCTVLDNITIPNGVTEIEDLTFSDCTSLTSITIPNGVTEIGYEAFFCCYNLTNITIPDTVTSIGIAAFECCHSLTSITIPAGITSIGKSMFEECIGLISVTIPDSVTVIGKEAFFHCEKLTSITIPSSVTEIGNMALWGCNELTDIYIDQPQNDTLFANASVPDGCKIHWNSTGSGSGSV